jgi:hypothetical protein
MDQVKPNRTSKAEISNGFPRGLGGLELRRLTRRIDGSAMIIQIEAN